MVHLDTARHKMSTAKTEPRFTLYYSPSSYYSHKVLLALYEKGEAFSERVVNVRVGEGREPWFMRINPVGQVPVLADASRVIPESEDIIDFLDTELSREPQLVPPLDTEIGKKVDYFRKLLVKEVDIAHVTYGVWYSPELSPGDPGSPKNKKEWEEFFEHTLTKLSRLADENADLKESYLQKIEAFKARLVVVRDKSRVKANIEALHPVFDQVEEELQLRDGESWLCGQTYTVADISLTELINRLVRLGLDDIFISSDNRKHVYSYWQRVQKRASFIMLKEHERLYKAKSQK